MKHATRKSIESGCECDGCRLTARLYAKDELFHPQRTATVDTAPFRAVMQSIVARGGTMADIGTATGCAQHTLRSIWFGERSHVYRSTADKLRRMTVLLPEGSS